VDHGTGELQHRQGSPALGEIDLFAQFGPSRTS
jgi:hypothetical protein